MNPLDQITYNVNKGPLHEDDVDIDVNSLPSSVKLIAFYLPQFHSIPENDEWWGAGFTEWTNVTKAVPRFVGHYQPRLPADVGFYDLRAEHVLPQQAAMAKKYGISGFCFHHYWFGGRRLLEMPIESLLNRPEIDLPYCINWANEPWSRRWDGSYEEILMRQAFSAEDDINFARSLEPYFRDPRYIRVDGRPLLMLYRPQIMPDAKATVRRWRRHFTEAGLGDPYIVMPQSYSRDPRRYGMDAAVGFPPFWTGADAPRIQDQLEPLDPNHACEVVDYELMGQRMVENHPSEFTLHPGVSPSWDNEARRTGRGSVFHGSTPAKYGAWLEAACRLAIGANPPSERLVFINAWNEWAEGAYLEPDRHFGYAYLRETARTLGRLSGQDVEKEAGQLVEALQKAEALNGGSRRPLGRRIADKVANRLERAARRLR
jgi:lipopolysaccharide biosynthesis protein